jgi:hypothetical protein
VSRWGSRGGSDWCSGCILALLTGVWFMFDAVERRSVPNDVL